MAMANLRWKHTQYDTKCGIVMENQREKIDIDKLI